MDQSESKLRDTPYRGQDSVAVYIHWPFCERKCPYCDFNSHVRDQIDVSAWQQAYFKELETVARIYPGLRTESIFFGGGTPSLMEPALVEALITRILHYWPSTNGETPEITLEANPSSVEIKRFQGYRTAGVNRLSIGVQAFDDQALKFLGRLHNKTEAEKALALAKDIFPRFTFDLIYARPGQTIESWAAELDYALGFKASHMSLYQLTIEEGTAFYYQYKRGQFTLPNEEESLALYHLTNNKMANAGLPLYEISNYAAFKNMSQHNLIYWQGKPYIGLGPGAHGRLPDDKGWAYATAAVKRPEDWLKRVDQSGHGFEDIQHVSPIARFEEAIMTGLRLREGVDLEQLEGRFHSSQTNILEEAAISDLITDGLIKRINTRIALTEDGRPLLNAILPKILL